MGRSRIVHLSGMVALAVLVVVAVPLDQGVDNPFQEGEYAIWSAARQAAPDAPSPVLIHGAIDVLPARIAALACPGDRQLGCVRTVNAALELAVGGLLVALLALLSGLGSSHAVAATLPCLLLVGVLGASATSPVEAQHGTPGVRDMAVLAGLLLMALIGRDRAARRSGLPFCLGVVAAVAPFWAYNRGVAFGLVAGAFTLALCIARRSVRPALPVVAGTVITVGLLVAAGFAPALRASVADIAYWRRNSAIWDAPGTWYDLAAAVLVHVVALGLAVPPARAALTTGRPGPALTALPLALTGWLYLIQSFNRPDPEHLRWSLWPAVLLMAAGIAARLNDAATPRTRLGCGATAVMTGLCALWLADRPPALWLAGSGLAGNARLLRTGLPPDRQLIGPSLLRAADIVREGGGCSFAANNAGLVHLLSGVPPCSRFWFGIYVAADEQAGVIAELEATRPPFIVWDAPNWWAHIDGRGLSQRNPQLAAWIEANYPITIQAGSEVLRSRTPQRVSYDPVRVVTWPLAGAKG